jgi:hypothetical protein
MAQPHKEPSDSPPGFFMQRSWRIGLIPVESASTRTIIRVQADLYPCFQTETFGSITFILLFKRPLSGKV